MMDIEILKGFGRLLLFFVPLVMVSIYVIRKVNRSSESRRWKYKVALTVCPFVVAMVVGNFTGGEHAALTGVTFGVLIFLYLIFGVYFMVKWVMSEDNEAGK